jgi:hypothetical protein
VLLPLMVELGSPVVLKGDNGAAFISDSFKRSMKHWGVTLLFSPPYCPSYNGACERGHRLLMDVARELQGSSGAALPLEQILPDARIDLNAKPTRRLSGQSPAQRWRDRPAIRADLRVHFSALLKNSRSRIRAEEGIAPDAKLSHRKQARIDRKAIQDVLLETHLLTIRRGDFGQEFLPRNVALTAEEYMNEHGHPGDLADSKARAFSRSTSKAIGCGNIFNGGRCLYTSITPELGILQRND